MNRIDFRKLCGYSIGTPKKFEKKINYVLAGNGGVEIRENEIGVFSAVTKKVPGLEPVKEGLQMRLPKIPLPILLQIISFFKDINSKHESEAIVQIFWNRQKKEYFCYCPKQEVSGASVDFKRDKEKEKEKRYLLVADVHSHNDMDAFFSFTDDKDEKETRLFGVVGNVDKALPDIQFRASSGNGSIEVSLEEIFDLKREYPKSWFKQVKTKELGLGNYGRQRSLWPDKEISRLNADPCKSIEVTGDIEDLKSRILKTLKKHEIEWLIEELCFNLDIEGGDEL